jgi:hypothetical protein
MGTPDEEVARRIAERFRQEKTLPDEAIEKLREEIANGRMTPEAWKLTIETLRPKKAEEPSHEDQ